MEQLQKKYHRSLLGFSVITLLTLLIAACKPSTDADLSGVWEFPSTQELFVIADRDLAYLLRPEGTTGADNETIRAYQLIRLNPTFDPAGGTLRLGHGAETLQLTRAEDSVDWLMDGSSERRLKAMQLTDLSDLLIAADANANWSFSNRSWTRHDAATGQKYSGELQTSTLGAVLQHAHLAPLRIVALSGFNDSTPRAIIINEATGSAVIAAAIKP